ncbi:DUF2267 domain-containing protein [Ancylobacter sp. SL191]|uniref:DUF2267 domain-containing protein n=1 Tax=Ancylobacter sp. SL191 TaxID=2995166 RepID=UPI00226F07E3|nr:DUF2267 domain-containing protein [Ancylobacter sp. SL191]WAC28572.1 DUF2267 domain-containing protein [Ancylobacter sp. SL191]
MTVPMTYRRASEAFDVFLAEVADAAQLSSRHQAYTVVDAVFRAFRRRLAPGEVLAFAAALPPLLGALFIENWRAAEIGPASWTEEEVLRDVKSLRARHNLATDQAVAQVGAVLRRHVDAAVLTQTLRHLPLEAARFWGMETATAAPAES